MPFVEIGARRVHYTARLGGRRAIVFLHGGFGSSSDLWTETIAALPPEWSAYAIDNFIDSQAPAEGYNVAAFARRSAGFVRALDLDRPVFVGHSMGGIVCQLTALDYPACVGGLVLVCTGASMTNHQLARDLLEDLRKGGGAAESLRAISAHWFHTAPPAFFDRYVARAVRAPLAAMISVQESLIAADTRARLAEINVPTLVVFGVHDTGRTVDHARTLTTGIRGAELAMMRDSGHTPMAETPAAFDAALHSFLNRLARVEA